VDDPGTKQAEEQQRQHRPMLAPAAVEDAHATPEAPLQRLASAIGNRGMGQVVARMADGEGLLADGTVHPDVASTIDALSGQGRRLDRQLLDRLAPTHGDLSDARIHTDPAADHLARAVSAKAFAVGRDVFFSKGTYDPASPAGFELAAHELAHVTDGRDAPRAGPMKATFPGDAIERAADERVSAALG
jgi:hypothetical protein